MKTAFEVEGTDDPGYRVIYDPESDYRYRMNGGGWAPGSLPNLYQCNSCDYRRRSEQHVKSHVERHHRPTKTATTTPSYEKITTVDHTGKRQTILLHILSETPAFVYGEELDADGSPVAHKNNEGAWVYHEHFIDTGTIQKRVPVEQDLMYGGFKPKIARNNTEFNPTCRGCGDTFFRHSRGHEVYCQTCLADRAKAKRRRAWIKDMMTNGVRASFYRNADESWPAAPDDRPKIAEHAGIEITGPQRRDSTYPVKPTREQAEKIADSEYGHRIDTPHGQVVLGG